MVIVLDLPAATSRLLDPEDVRSFHVQVIGARTGPYAEIAHAFETARLGRFESLDQAHISVERVREMARGKVGPQWESAFSGMLDYAARKGWYDAAGGTIQAHCELEDDRST